MMRRQSDFHVRLAVVLVELRCVISDSEDSKIFVSSLANYVNRPKLWAEILLFEDFGTNLVSRSAPELPSSIPRLAGGPLSTSS